MKMIIRICLLMVVLVIGVFIVTFRIMPSTKSEFYLSKNEVATLEERAKLHDDVAAATKLALYYYFSRDDENNAIRWYRFAAERGDADAQRAVKKLEAIKDAK